MEEPKRVIVLHEGNDSGNGMWKCKSSCSKSTSCVHIKSAQNQLQRWIQSDPEARHEMLMENGDNELIEAKGKC